MSELDVPESWAEASLDSILLKISDGTHHSPPNKAAGKYKYVTAKNIKNYGLDLSNITFISEKIHKEIYARCDPKLNDILLIKDGATTGVAAINTLDEEFSLLSSVALLRVPQQQIEPKFLLYFLKGPEFQKTILGDMAGAAIKRVTLKKLSFMIMPVVPFREQQRIVAKIESCFSKIDATEKALDEAEILLKKYRESLLAKAFRGELVLQNPEDEPASELLKRIRAERAEQNSGKKRPKDELPPIAEQDIPFEIPKSWEWVRLGDLEVIGIFYDIQDGNHGELHPKAKDYVANGVPFVMANNIKNGLLDLSSCKKLSKTLTDRLRIGFSHSGDVLLTHKGTIGACAVVPSVNGYVMLTPQVTYYRISKNAPLLNDYLCLCFGAPFFQSKLASISKQATRDYVGITRQKELLIPLPPKLTQENMILSVKKAFSLITLMDQKIKAARQSLGNKRASGLEFAFSGRLVPQILEEGTGQALLEQILKVKGSAAELDQKSSPSLKGGLKGKKKK